MPVEQASRSTIPAVAATGAVATIFTSVQLPAPSRTPANVAAMVDSACTINSIVNAFYLESSRSIIRRRHVGEDWRGEARRMHVSRAPGLM